MPRSKSDKAPAFHQVGKVHREAEIQAMSIPSLTELAPTYGRIAVHYVKAVVVERGGESYLDRIFTPEG
eukprot:8659846-Ditylum_brightwellii.AAC.1